jgi:hypothetical protein
MSEPSRVRVIPFPNGERDRVETGAVQFGNDWPGLFVRGDEAFDLTLQIEAIERFVNSLPDKVQTEAGMDMHLALATLKDLAETIRTDVIVTS